MPVASLVRKTFDTGLPLDMAAWLGLSLCFSIRMALPSMCSELNRRLMADDASSSTPHPEKAPNSLYSFFAGQRGRVGIMRITEEESDF